MLRSALMSTVALQREAGDAICILVRELDLDVSGVCEEAVLGGREKRDNAVADRSNSR